MIEGKRSRRRTCELDDSLPELKDKTLGCWCKPEKCHGDVLVELIDRRNNIIKLQIEIGRPAEVELNWVAPPHNQWLCHGSSRHGDSERIMSNRGNYSRDLPNILIIAPSLVKDMNINQFSGLYIMAVAAVFVTTIAATSVTPAAIAQNMNGAGNMTAGGANMTDMNQTGSISQIVPQNEQEQEQETGDIDITGGEGGQIGSGNDQEGNTGSGDEQDYEN